jgi:hypothetical protein
LRRFGLAYEKINKASQSTAPDLIALTLTHKKRLHTVR